MISFTYFNRLKFQEYTNFAYFCNKVLFSSFLQIGQLLYYIVLQYTGNNSNCFKFSISWPHSTLAGSAMFENVCTFDGCPIPWTTITRYVFLILLINLIYYGTLKIKMPTCCCFTYWTTHYFRFKFSFVLFTTKNLFYVHMLIN